MRFDVASRLVDWSGVTSLTQLAIDQALLGYDRGHRILASSRLIESHSKHAFLQFSDRSISARKIPESGYLTGYPLADEGLYVLAKTWDAPEIERPGCIWTHSLLISYTELAEIGDPRTLLACFRRPQRVGENERYSVPVILDMNDLKAWPAVEKNLAKELLVRLYGSPSQKVFLQAGDQKEVDATLLAVWGQQWPRLRRSFRFCTLTQEDRSTDQHYFDVQFLPPGHAPKNESGDEDVVEREVWISLCLGDLVKANPEFRRFLWRAGSDISGGRARFAELCRLFAERGQSKKARAVERALGYVLHRLPDEEGKLLRNSAIEDAVNVADQLSPEWLMEILPYLDDYSQYMNEGSSYKLAHRYWDIDPEVVVGEGAPRCLRTNSDELIRSLSQDKVVDAIGKGGQVAEAVLSQRLDVLESSETWHSEIAELATDALPRIVDGRQQRAVVFALIEATRSDLADYVCRVFGSGLVFDAALSAREEKAEVAGRYAEKAFFLMEDRESVVRKTLGMAGVKVARSLIHAFSESVTPDIPKCKASVEVDPWVVLWRNGAGEVGARKHDQIMSFLVVRAILEPSSHVASLFATSFDRVLDRYSEGKLRYESRSRVLDHLVLSDWFEWTFESRLTRTVAMVVFQQGLSGRELREVTSKKSRLKRLMRAIADLEGGREYLRDVGVNY